MGKYKVDQKKFNLVKTLIDSGVNKSQTAKVAGISMKVVYTIIESSDLADYRKRVSEQFARKKAYDEAKEQREMFKDLPLDQYICNVGVGQPKVQPVQKKSYTVTMVINVDEEHEPLVAPLTALINNMFTPNDVAVEVNGDD